MTKKKVKTHSRFLRASQAGQGTVEYVLLLVVVIALAGALLTRFFQPFDKWAKNYLGEYFYCLLNEGELPSLGGQNATGDCNANFEEFSLASGRAAKESKAKQEAAAAAEKGKKSEKSERKQDFGTSAVASGSKSKPFLSNPRKTGTDGAPTGKVGTSIAADTHTGGYMNIRRPTVITVRRDGERARGVIGMLDQEKQKAKKREAKVSVRKASVEEGGVSRQRKPALAAAKLRTTDANTEISGYDFSFGYMIRMAFIIAIIALLIFLVANQLNSISKSLEK